MIDGGDHAADEQAHDGAEAHQRGGPPDRDAHDQARAAAGALRRAVVQRPRAGRAVEDVRVRLADRELRRFVRSLAGQPATQEKRHPAECGRRLARDAPDPMVPRPGGTFGRRRAPGGCTHPALMRLSIDKDRFLLAFRGHGRPRPPAPRAPPGRLPPDRAAPRGDAPDRCPDGPLLGGRPRARGAGPPPGDRSRDDLPDAGRPLRARGGRADRPAEWRARLRGCAPTHHHHVVCSRCGRTAEIEDAGLRAVVREVTRRTGFRVDEHRLELFGLCSACQAATAG